MVHPQDIANMSALIASSICRHATLVYVYVFNLSFPWASLPECSKMTHMTAQIRAKSTWKSRLLCVFSFFSSFCSLEASSSARSARSARSMLSASRSPRSRLRSLSPLDQRTKPTQPTQRNGRNVREIEVPAPLSNALP